MSTVDQNIHFDFTDLLYTPKGELLAILTDTHTQIANLTVQAAFLRAEEIRKTPGAHAERVEKEALRDAYTEKKWLITKLLDHQVFDDGR